MGIKEKNRICLMEKNNELIDYLKERKKEKLSTFYT